MSSRLIKTALLAVTLAVPVLIYLFLQSFGQNQYEVPLYYQQGIEEPVANCSSQQPHVVNLLPTSDWQSTAVNINQINDQLTVIGFSDKDCAQFDFVWDEFARVCNNYRNDARVRGLSIPLSSEFETSPYEQRLNSYQLNVDDWNLMAWDSTVTTVLNCALNLPLDCSTAASIVLLDGQRRIRGYYQAADQEEVDRLITEIEILLVNGEDKSN